MRDGFQWNQGGKVGDWRLGEARPGSGPAWRGLGLLPAQRAGNAGQGRTAGQPGLGVHSMPSRSVTCKDAGICICDFASQRRVRSGRHGTRSFGGWKRWGKRLKLVKRDMVVGPGSKVLASFQGCWRLSSLVCVNRLQYGAENAEE